MNDDNATPPIGEEVPLSRSEGLAWAEAWQHAQAAKERAEESMARAGSRLCRRAKEVLEAGHHLTRSGQYPEVTEIFAVGVQFHVSNGIDRADDFDILLRWDDLTPPTGRPTCCEHHNANCADIEEACCMACPTWVARPGRTAP